MERRGFTLVELLIVLAVGSILLAIAIPGYAFLVNASRLATVTNDLVTVLHLARSEAIKRGVRVTVCKTGNAGAATPADHAGAPSAGAASAAALLADEAPYGVGYFVASWSMEGGRTR